MVKHETIEKFLSDLASKEPVPGGGGASALAGAFGVSLALMVVHLTVGKKKYRDKEPLLLQCEQRLLELKEEFFRLSDRDEEVFLPLSKAYGLPKETEEEKRIRREVMGKALKNATEAPLQVMEAAWEALKITKTVAECGSKLAISDAGVAAAYLRTALSGASYNVIINLDSMEDGPEKEAFRSRSEELLQNGQTLSDETEAIVRKRISG